jgi:hypothetical protein
VSHTSPVALLARHGFSLRSEHLLPVLGAAPYQTPAWIAELHFDGSEPADFRQLGLAVADTELGALVALRLACLREHALARFESVLAHDWLVKLRAELARAADVLGFALEQRLRPDPADLVDTLRDDLAAIAALATERLGAYGAVRVHVNVHDARELATDVIAAAGGRSRTILRADGARYEEASLGFGEGHSVGAFRDVPDVRTQTGSRLVLVADDSTPAEDVRRAAKVVGADGAVIKDRFGSRGEVG